ncbi:MAG: hypothetical protein ABSF90_08230 [Syntrophobacteraceae bacterium]|jgi:hypothetical protein
MRAGDRLFKGFPLLIVLLLSWGCTTTGPNLVATHFERPSALQEMVDKVDGAVLNSNVIDASSFRVSGFPYLRTSRFLLAMKDQLKTGQEEEEWLQLMGQLAEESREKEILNLPESEFSKLQRNGTAPVDRQDFIAEAKSCSQELLRHESAMPGFYETLFSLLKVPDEYSSQRRGIGLFPIVSIPVDIVSERVKKKFQAWYNEPIDQLPLEGNLRFYSPCLQADLSQSKLAEVLRSASASPLGIPLLEETDKIKLAAFFAPVLIQDVAGLYDRIGRVYWNQGKPDVNPLKPTIYYYFSHALIHDHPILQINYVIWYSERTGHQSPKIERGHLDGLTLRVSLDSVGMPFMVDMMNNCGCYHFFSPQREAVLQIKSSPDGLEPFVPQWLPRVHPGERLGIRVNSGWHQVQRLLPVDSSENAIEYDLIPYRLLESLQERSGNRRSMFDAKGIAVSTERIEPLIFFSMGIPSIGSMRQRGHHAIELTGRDHFDDPLLFEKNFVLK